MKGFTLLTPYLAFLFVNYTNANCTVPTDSDADLNAAGYNWEAVLPMSKVAQGPGVNPNDLYTSGETYDGRLNLSVKVSVPKRDSHSPQGLSLSNGFTTDFITGAKVTSVYRILFTIANGPNPSQDEREVSYLLKDNEECSFFGTNVGFDAEDVKSITAERLVKL